MKKLLRSLVIGLAVCALALPVMAENITLNWGNYTVKVNVPDDIAGIVKANQSKIETALAENNVSETQVTDAMTTVNTEYGKLKSELGTVTPYQTAVNGLNDFCDDLCDTIPDTQTLQNVWAESWLGMLIPNCKFGFGVNAGVAALDVKALKRTANALSIKTGDLQDTLVFPTVAADLRLGGIVYPFDIGLVFSTLDSRWFGPLDDAISPCGFDYFSIGGDFRYQLLNIGGKYFHVRGSVSAGGYYTKGGLEVEEKNSKASMDFSSTTLFLGGQLSAKAACLIPFLGARLAFVKSKVDWDAKADWTEILSDSTQNVKNAASWGILPTNFSGGASSGWGVRPQVFGGLGIDLFVIDITASVSYDLAKKIPGGALSVRFCI